MMNPQDQEAVWPSSPTDLIDIHRCPACFTPIVEMTCRRCGLALDDPRAAQLLELGRAIADSDRARRELIAEIRRAHAGATRPADAAYPVAVDSAAVTAPSADSAAVPALIADSAEVPPVATAHAATWMHLPPPHAEDLRSPAAPPPMPEPAAPAAASAAFVAEASPAAPPPTPPPPATPRAPAAESRPRRRLSVPVLLLIVGVSLVGVAAIFFLLLAWFVAGIAVRALIIGAITAATMVTASVLRKRELTATAEGIAALGVILLALDAWAVRANDLFGAGALRPAVYAGIGALVVALLLRAWARLSGLRGPDLAAAIALPAGVGFLVGGLTQLAPAEALVAGLLGASIGGLAWALPVPWSAAREPHDAVPERVTLAVLGVAALVAAAGVAAFASPESTLTLWSTPAILGVSTAHAVLLRPRAVGGALPWGGVLFGTATLIGAVVTGVLGWQLAVRDGGPAQLAFLGPVIAIGVAVVLDRVGRRVLRIATIAAAIVGAASLLTAVMIWSTRALSDLSTGWNLWRTPSFERPSLPVDVVDSALWCALGALTVAALTFFAPTLSRPGWRDARAAAAAALALLAAALTAVPALTVAAGFVVAVVGVTFVARRSPAAIGWRIAAACAAATAYLAGTTAPALWLVGVVTAVGVPIAVHITTSPRGAAAVRLTLAAVAVATISAFVAPGALAAASGLFAADAAVPLVLVQWVALLALVVAVALPLDRATRATLAVSASGLIVLSFARALLPVFGLVTDEGSLSLLGEPVAGIIRTAALTGLLAVVALGRTRIVRAPAWSSASLVAPVAASAVFAVLDVARLDGDRGMPLALMAVAVAVTWTAALSPARAYAGPPADRSRVRGLADGGALATGAALATTVDPERLWAVCVLAAFGFAGASLTRGWAAPRAAALPGVASSRAAGTDASAAPRRLLSWPALALGTLGLWFWLAALPGEITVEAFMAPPAIGMIVFGALLVWVRRYAEATIAGALGAALGLVVPALASGSNSAPLRGTLVAVVAAIACLALSCTVARRLRLTSLVTATVALGAFSIVALERTADPFQTGVDAEALWAVGLVVLAYATAIGFTAGRREEADAAPEAGYALVVPPLALGAAAVSALPEVEHRLTLTLAVALCLLLHLTAARVNRRPFAAATRWAAMGSAVVLAAAALAAGTVTTIEMLSVPLALAVLGGAALALWRRTRAGDLSDAVGESTTWLVGLAAAVLPSILSPAEPVRMWLVIVAALLAAIGCAVAPVATTRRLGPPSAALLAGGAVLMGARVLTDPDVAGGEVAALVAGAGAVLVAAALVSMAGSDRPGRLSSVVAVTGTTLLVATTFYQSVTDGGDPAARTALTAVVAGVAGVGGAALLRSSRWRGVAASLAVGGLIAGVACIAFRFADVASNSSFGLEPDLWAVAGVGLVAAIGIATLRSTADRAIELTVGGVFTIAVVLFAVAAVTLLGADSASDAVRTVVTMGALSLAGFGAIQWRARLGIALPLAVGVALVLFGLSALTVHGVFPVEAVSAPPAIVLLALGVRRLRRDAAARSWPTLGPGLTVLLLPSLLFDFGQNELWRIVTLGIVTVGIVVVGAIGKLQAPLVLGSAVLLVHAVAQLWPWISSGYVAVPWWLWLGIGGAVLIVIAARYEKQMRALRTAFTAVSSLR